MSRTREERETIIRFDETDEHAYISTFSASQARRWIKAGVTLTQRGAEWMGRIEKRAVRACRRVDSEGRVLKKKGAGRFRTRVVSAVGAPNSPEAGR
jgi:hypothetical protein